MTQKGHGMLTKTCQSSYPCCDRVIGLFKNHYTILQGPLPISLIKHTSDHESDNIDKLLTTCAELTNPSKSIVPS